EGTLSSRLATARKLLAARLARHGVALSPAALAMALAAQTAAGVPPLLAAATRQTAFAGSSPHVAALTEGVLRKMFATSLTARVIGVLLAVMVGLGIAFGTTSRRTAPREETHAAKPEGLPAQQASLWRSLESLSWAFAEADARRRTLTVVT